jgi:DNA repair exonuclease SbcCD ATPase subunit
METIRQTTVQRTIDNMAATIARLEEKLKAKQAELAAKDSELNELRNSAGSPLDRPGAIKESESVASLKQAKLKAEEDATVARAAEAEAKKQLKAKEEENRRLGEEVRQFRADLLAHLGENKPVWPRHVWARDY